MDFGHAALTDATRGHLHSRVPRIQRGAENPPARQPSLISERHSTVQGPDAAFAAHFVVALKADDGLPNLTGTHDTNSRCRVRQSGGPYMPSFRGKPACSCLVAWLVAYERELLRLGVIKHNLDVYQLRGTASASAGTHSQGGAFDLGQFSTEALKVARQMGADADWHRTPAQGFIHHAHGVLRGCPHNTPARYQIAAVDAGYNGLGNQGHGGKDDGPRPLSGRTWDQGIKWAAAQGKTPVVPPKKTVTIKDPRITESSWLALSVKFPGKYAYTGNDEAGFLYTIDLDNGNTVGTFALGSMKLVDPESGDCHNGSLWVADIGDNDATRPYVNLYALAEPGSGNKGPVPVERYRVRYSNGPRNAEAFFIHPHTGHRYIITKQASGELYRNDLGTLDQSTVGTFRLVGRKLPAYVTEAKFTPDARFVLARQKGQPTTVTVLDGDTFKVLERIPVASVHQPESLDTDGISVWFGSEGSKSPLVREPLPAKYRSQP